MSYNNNYNRPVYNRNAGAAPHGDSNGKPEYFVNPYTFIPLGSKEPERCPQDNSAEGKISGHIDCTLDIRTPVFIPNTTKVFETGTEGHKEKVFLSYTNLENEISLTKDLRQPSDPVIPGSEIRGMIRNVYEQLTNSCMLHIDEFNLPYKRTNEPKILCIMVWDGNHWKIYPSQSANGGRIFKKGNAASAQFDYAKGVVLWDGNTPYFSFDGWNREDDVLKEYENAFNLIEKCNSFNFKGTGDYDNNIKICDGGKYYLHVPSAMPQRERTNNMIAYSGHPSGTGYIVSESALSQFEKVLGLADEIGGGYLDEGLKSKKYSYRAFRIYANNYKAKKPLIVYADKNSVSKSFMNDNIYLSPACMTKEFFNNTIDKILKKNIVHGPCESKETICPACRLFGMVGDNGAAEGKLRFTDSRNPTNIEYGRTQVLPILGNPKIASTEFYLQRPADAPKDEKTMWNYDYYVTYSKKVDRGRTEYVFNRHPYTPQLSGRKVYWNRDPVTKDATPGKMNCTVTPLKRGHFDFRVYFDRVSKEELEKLLFCLRLSEKAYHKIGGGKPIGFGQIKIRVGEVITESYALEDGKIEKKKAEYSSDTSIENRIRASSEAKYILKYSEDIDEKALIDYPRCVDSADIFTWFAKNRGTPSAPSIIYTLPRIDDQSQKLTKHINKKQNFGR
ncbi:MAG: TIGR03986 family CRISPR-associated RAMP protein [Clostridiales bacterium]|nr:TIGR03986 family CRISPR-associated RAMP protein [Clostridiales bacterium]